MARKSVELLWKHNKDHFWELGDTLVEVTLQDLYDDAQGSTKLDELERELREEMDFHFRSDLLRHRASLRHKLDLMQNGLPEEHAIVLIKTKKGVTNCLEDGNHRLVAARLLGLKTVPVTTTRKNPDEDIRKLERAARSGNIADIKAYWLALLRSGQMPPYETRISYGPYNLKLKCWILYNAQEKLDLDVALIPRHFAGFDVNVYIRGQPQYTRHVSTEKAALEFVREALVEYCHG